MKALLLTISIFFYIQSQGQSFDLASVIDTSKKKGEITGTVYDNNSNTDPLGFAVIKIKETSISTETGIDGSYSINLKPGKYTLVFEFIGYNTIEIENVEVKANSITQHNQVLNSLVIDNSIVASRNEQKIIQPY